VTARHTGYRTAWLLTGLILLGWLVDATLLDGSRHWPGWLLALVLVGGITFLAAWAGQRNPPAVAAAAGPDTAQPPVEPQLAESFPIRPAREDELPELIEIEVAADRLFPLAGYGETPGPASLEELRGSPITLVAGDPPVGYARVDLVDGRAHLESLSVRPRYMRRGIGGALVRAACEWAAEQGYSEITLCTFADVRWNAPFYRTLGFTELTELTPGLQALRATEHRIGLERMGPRLVMIRRLAGADGPAPAGTLDR